LKNTAFTLRLDKHFAILLTYFFFLNFMYIYICREKKKQMEAGENIFFFIAHKGKKKSKWRPTRLSSAHTGILFLLIFTCSGVGKVPITRGRGAGAGGKHH
jgi:hypothetical protein